MIKRKKPSTSKLNGSAESYGLYSSIDYANNTLNNNICQDSKLLNYTEDSEIKEKFQPKHKKSIYLSKIYDRLGKDKKALRVCDCGSFLEFAHEVDANGVIDEHGKLHFARFCRDRFCPMCSWRRSLKLFANVSKCIPKLTQDYKCLFLTLTIPNCKEEDFRETIDRLMKSWDRLTKYKKWKTLIKGFFRVLEITRNKNKDSEFYGTLHPHFHIILVVPKSYGKKEGMYISRNEFLEMWQQAFQDDSITQVDIRLLKPKDTKDITNSSEIILLKNIESGLFEVCKYTLKDSDFLDESLPEEEQDNLLKTLADGLHHRRLAHFGGVFKDIYKSLDLEDIEDDNCNLVNIDDDSISSGVALLLTRYRWGMGSYQFYDKILEYSKEVINE